MPAEPAHCLVIAGVYPPAGGGGALRLVKLLKHLPAHGWRPHVLAPRARSGWFADPALLAEVADIPVTRVGLSSGGRLLESARRRAKDPRAAGSGVALLRSAVTAARHLRDRLAVPDEHLAWAALAARRAAQLLRRRRFDLLVTTSFPYSCHLAGLVVRRPPGTAWWADFADPWAGHPVRGQDVGLRTRLDALLEGRVLRAADLVSVVSPGMERMMGERWPWVTDKLCRVANSFDPDEIPPRPARSTSQRRRPCFELLFVGTLDARVSPPRPFIEALVKLARERPELRSRLRLRVLGGADLEASRYLRARLAEVGGEEMVRLEGYASHAEALRAMVAADALAISVAPGAHWHLTAKVFEYLASATPILAAVPAGDCRDLLAQAGGAAAFDPTDVSGLAHALVSAIDRGSLAVDAERRPEVIGELAAAPVARRLAARLDRLLGRAGGG